jgi:pimeloyl-ACP methyl ester carboxylesterase
MLRKIDSLLVTSLNFVFNTLSILFSQVKIQMQAPSSSAALSAGSDQGIQAFPVTLGDGAKVIVRHLGSGPRLVLSHGSGLAIDAYSAFWKLLSKTHQVVMFDFRHHGLSSPLTHPVSNWPQFLEDFDTILGAIETKLGKAPSVGVFHSMSAITALVHASFGSAPWEGLVAFEPPVPVPEDHRLRANFLEMHGKLIEITEKRRSSFPSIEALANSFASREHFRRLSPEAVQGLAASTLRPNISGGFDLACDRNFEAETYRFRNLPDAWQRATSLPMPVMIVSSQAGPGENHLLEEVARAVADDGNYEFARVEDSTHFLQLERPEQCANIVETFTKSRGLQ